MPRTLPEPLGDHRCRKLPTLNGQLAELRELNKRVLGLANELAKGTIDTVMAASDADLGWRRCSGGVPERRGSAVGPGPHLPGEFGIAAQPFGDLGVDLVLAVVLAARAQAPAARLDLGSTRPYLGSGSPGSGPRGSVR